jgi:gamma-glutamyltranspeptidase
MARDAVAAPEEDAFGSRIIVRGFLLNNQLTDFSFTRVKWRAMLPREGGEASAHAAWPGARLDSAGRCMLAGSPAASIINYVAKALVAALDWKLDDRGHFAASAAATDRQLERGTCTTGATTARARARVGEVACT